MAIPVKYRKFKETAIASYDFIDIASGIGFKKFYAVGTNSSSGKQYSLSSEVIASDVDNYQGSVSDLDIESTDVAAKGEWNFDLPIQRSLTLAACDVLINTTLGLSIGGGGASELARLKYRLYRVVGGTEYLIGSQVTTQNESSSSSTAYRLSTRYTIPRTDLRVGDTLRLEIQIWGYRSAGTVSTAYIMFDGANRSTVSGSPFTNLAIDLHMTLGFRIDL